MFTSNNWPRLLTALAVEVMIEARLSAGDLLLHHYASDASRTGKVAAMRMEETCFDGYFGAGLLFLYRIFVVVFSFSGHPPGADSPVSLRWF
jgi:hypothetical protein